MYQQLSSREASSRSRPATESKICGFFFPRFFPRLLPRASIGLSHAARRVDLMNGGAGKHVPPERTGIWGLWNK